MLRAAISSRCSIEWPAPVRGRGRFCKLPIGKKICNGAKSLSISINGVHHIMLLCKTDVSVRNTENINNYSESRYKINVALCQWSLGLCDARIQARWHWAMNGNFLRLNVAYYNNYKVNVSYFMSK